MGVAPGLLIRSAILAGEFPFPLNKYSLEIIIWVDTLVAWRSVADFNVHHLFGRFIYQAMSVTRAGLEARTHPRAELAETFIRV
jgi:hypothetical protein